MEQRAKDKTRVLPSRKSKRPDGEHLFLSGYESSNYVWCLHCERVWPKSDWISKGWNCPGNDCDGGPLDAWKWEEHFFSNPKRPECPENPKPWSSWPLYPVEQEPLAESVACEGSQGQKRRRSVARRDP